MVKIVLGIFIFSCALFALDWEKDFDSALLTAQKEHKNIMVMVEGEHCRWCKKMKARTFLDDSVEKRLSLYVVVKVMRENEKAMAKLPPIEGVPTIFFMKENKAVIEEVMGYYNVEDFISYLDKIEAKNQ